MTDLASRIAWPAEGVARVPYVVYSDPEVHEWEQTHIFRGPAWHFLGLEAQIPDVGNYTLVDVGATPVIVLRDNNGEVAAFVNRCAHKGTQLLFVPHGTVKQVMCVYHNWCYD